MEQEKIEPETLDEDERERKSLEALDMLIEEITEALNVTSEMEDRFYPIIIEWFRYKLRTDKDFSDNNPKFWENRYRITGIDNHGITIEQRARTTGDEPIGTVRQTCIPHDFIKNLISFGSGTDRMSRQKEIQRRYLKKKFDANSKLLAASQAFDWAERELFAIEKEEAEELAKI